MHFKSTRRSQLPRPINASKRYACTDRAGDCKAGEDGFTPQTEANDGKNEISGKFSAD